MFHKLIKPVFFIGVFAFLQMPLSAQENDSTVSKQYPQVYNFKRTVSPKIIQPFSSTAYTANDQRLKTYQE